MSGVAERPRTLRSARRPALVRVALAGCGVVGGELVRMLAAGAEAIQARHGVRFELASVLVRHGERPRPAELDPRLVTTELAAFLASDATLWVEAIGGERPALDIARHAMGRGDRLVTANKALLAAHGPGLVALARRSGGRLDFESAVGGGIPVVRALRDSLGLTGIHALRGVLNGTSNFILTRLEEGRRYPEALAEAQALGFAEADPARDLSGEDAADKLRVLAWLGFGIPPGRLRVRRRGLEDAPERLVALAGRLGGVLRLVGEAVEVAGGVAAVVEPVVVAPGSELGRTREEENAIVIESRWNGRVRLSGPGAGGGPTASAVLGDMLRPAARPAPQGSAAPAASEDSRAQRWAVGTPRRGGGDSGAAARVLARAGVIAREVPGAGDDRVLVTLPVPWERMDLALRVLQSAQLAPVVARCEVEVW